MIAKLQTMKCRSLRMAAAAVAAVFFLLSSTAIWTAAAAAVEHTFVVSQEKMTHLYKETAVTVVNGQLPGPTIEVTEGDSMVVHLVNRSPYNITIHWHGVKQRLNCWSDGVPMVTQRPILPNHNFTYRFMVIGQEGTLWWHAHTSCLRGTVHGAFIIRPRHGAGSYPFPKPHKEIPIIIGEWWEMDLHLLATKMMNGFMYDFPRAATINGKLGDLFNCSGSVEDGYVLNVEHGKTYLLRVINAALFSEYYLKIAGHKFTVVGSDANYVSPYTTDVIAVAPGETVDALVVADAPPGRYYMVALGNQAPEPETQLPVYVSRGIVQYSSSHSLGNATEALSSSRNAEDGDAPVAPEMPDQHDTLISFYFHGNLTGLRHLGRPVPAQVDEHMFLLLTVNSICRQGQSCKWGGSADTLPAASMNNVSFQFPAATTPLLEAHYYHTSDMDTLQELPAKPPREFNYTDRALTPWGPKEARLEPTSRATVARRFQHGTVVDVVFQSSSLLSGDSNPMHLHGHDMFVLAQGLGNYDAATDVAKYNLVNPAMKNTVVVPNLGWLVVRFVADNPGVWFMHCHYEFHLSMGMAAVFIVEDGPTLNTSLPPPPMDFPTCHHEDNHVPNESYLPIKKSDASRINEV